MYPAPLRKLSKLFPDWSSELVRLKENTNHIPDSLFLNWYWCGFFRPVIGVDVKWSGKRAEYSLHHLISSTIHDDLTPVVT